MTDSDTTSTLSESLGTETLEARSTVPAEYRERPEVESVWVDGRKFLKVDHAANIRMWNDAAEKYPTLHRYALDTLAIPATSTECERIFSSAKKLVTPERNRLSDDIIEATECLKAWWDSGVISQQW
jgi:hypothetical protein